MASSEAKSVECLKDKISSVIPTIVTSSEPKSSEPEKKSESTTETSSNNATTSRLKYGRVVISLENPILDEEVIRNTPSVQDGLDPDVENDLRITGCRLIQISGILLRLPQVAMATGQVLFQRYYYCKSFVRFPMEITAMACVVLACKVEEAPRRIRDVINVFHNMKQIRLEKPLVPLMLDENYVSLKNQVVKSERRILKELGFCVHVKHPHKFIVAVAQILKNENNTELIQTAWSYMNDSLQTNVFVRYPPETIAVACIHLSSRVLRVPLPENIQWYNLFNVDSDTIEQVCLTILKLYTRRTLPQEELESKVEETRKQLDLLKLKSRSKKAESGTTSTVENNNSDSIGSRTNSPKVLPHSSSKNLELLSVINRLKDGSKKSPLESKDNGDSDSVTALSTPSTPIKLQKSPSTLKNSKLPAKYRKDYRSDRSDSSMEMDDERDRYREKVSSSKSHRNNGHHHQVDRYDKYESDRYRDRSPRPYVSSKIISDGYSSSKHKKRHRSRSRSPLYEMHTSRHRSSHRVRDDYRDDRYSSSLKKVHRR